MVVADDVARALNLKPLATLVQAAAVVAVVLFGTGVAMSENGPSMRRGLGILFGLSIAFAASTFFLQFFGFAGGAEIA